MTEQQSVAVAVAQFAPGADSAANLATIERLAASAVSRGARLVVFPEYASFFEATLGEAYLDAAEPVDGPFVRRLGELADRFGIALVAGLVRRTDDRARFSNTLVAVAPGRGLVATYDKQHLYDAFGGRESEWIVPGTAGGASTFTHEGFVFGLQTCYDVRFPEVSRLLVDAGAEIVLVPAEWVRGPLKEHHWRTLVTARALENTVFVAAADHAPPVGVGNSMIVDPMGVELVTIGDESEGVAVAHLTRERLRAVREINPALTLRRYSVVARTD